MDHSAYIDAAAATLGLSLTQEQRKGVALYFGLAASMAVLVQGLPLTPADAPVVAARRIVGPTGASLALGVADPDAG
mgnify:CR=1 FL=1